MSCATIDPSTPNIAFDPPPFGKLRLLFIVKGKYGATNGGTNPQISFPDPASKA